MIYSLKNAYTALGAPRLRDGFGWTVNVNVKVNVLGYSSQMDGKTSRMLLLKTD